MVAITVFLLSCFITVIVATTLQSVARDQGQVVFAYPKDVFSERDLSECPTNTACNVIYRRFWQPPLIERYCRCPVPSECPWRWSSGGDNRTMILDNRSQLKFCANLKDMPTCQDDQQALTVSTKIFQHTTRRPHAARKSQVAKLRTRSNIKAQKRVQSTNHRAVTAQCNCRGLPYWSPGSKSDDEQYLCSKLTKCDSGQTCGYVRTDLHSVYYSCSCPDGHQCVSLSKETHTKKLLLYTGPVYNATCTPTN